MNQDDGYQDITDFESVLQYIENMDGFRNFPIGTVQYDGATLSLGIEEIVKGQSWPSDASGRVWFLSFSQISNITLDIDVAMRLWINEMYIEEDNTFVIECGEGSIAVLAGNIELAVPVESSATDSALPLVSTVKEASQNVKGIINDIKNVVTHGRDQTTQVAQPIEPAASANVMAQVSPQTVPTPNLAPAQATPTAPTIQSTNIAPIAPSAPSPNITQNANPFLKDPNSVPLQSTIPTPPRTPEPPTNNPVVG